MLKRIGLLLAFIFLNFLSSYSQKKIQLIDSIFSSLYKKGEFNGNVLIAEKGVPVYQKCFGLANIKTNQRLNEYSVFELASVSKQFTAMAIVILKDRGKLNLSDDIRKYIPELPYKGMTIKNLLHHTSGIPDYMNLMDSFWNKNLIATNKDIVNLLVKYHPDTLFSPQTKYEYSNTGFALLANIIEKTSGKSYSEFLKENIFDPLEMKNTLIVNRRYQPMNLKNYAFGYIYSDSLNKYVLPDELPEYSEVIWLDGIVGDGCVNSTILDLLKWDRALYTTQLVSQNDMDEIFTSDTLTDGTPTHYGFGWQIENIRHYGKIVSHSGGWPGYSTYIERHLSSDKTIIVLQNMEKEEQENSDQYLTTLRKIFYNEPLQRKEMHLPENTLTGYAGKYKIMDNYILTITIENNKLYAQLTGQKKYQVFAESENILFYKVVDAEIEFVKNENGNFDKIILLQGGQVMEGKKRD